MSASDGFKSRPLAITTASRRKNSNAYPQLHMPGCEASGKMYRRQIRHHAIGDLGHCSQMRKLPPPENLTSALLFAAGVGIKTFTCGIFVLRCGPLKELRVPNLSGRNQLPALQGQSSCVRLPSRPQPAYPAASHRIIPDLVSGSVGSANLWHRGVSGRDLAIMAFRPMLPCLLCSPRQVELREETWSLGQ